jgi:putative transcriptional regulator
VVLLLDHDEDGTLGVVLNRITDIDVGSILPSWRVHVSGDPQLFDGGPVARDSALGLAALPGPETHEPEGFRRVTGALGLVDLDLEPGTLADELAGLRIFAGYAGWSPGQLDDEMDEGAWYVVPARRDDVFTADPAGLWRTVLRRQPGELAFLATFPDDPTLN